MVVSEKAGRERGMRGNQGLVAQKLGNTHTHTAVKLTQSQQFLEVQTI